VHGAKEVGNHRTKELNRTDEECLGNQRTTYIACIRRRRLAISIEHDTLLNASSITFNQIIAIE